MSPATVSKALNNAHDVSTKTRERVLAVAQSLGYEPSLLAQTMRNRRSRTIGVLTQRPLHYQWVAETLSGILDAAAAAGMAALVLLTSREADEANSVQACLARLRRRQVEGFVYIGTGTPPPLGDSLAGWAVPHIYTFCQPLALDAPAVLVDDGQGAALAVRHLVDSGRRHFALLSGPPWSGTALARAAGAHAALATAGVPVDPARERVGTWDEAFGFAATRDLIANSTPFDAVVAANDFVALGALYALAEAGRRVPDDVAVVGFDNHVVGGLARPRLTTVAMPAYDCGHRAAQHLIGLLSLSNPGATPKHAQRRRGASDAAGAGGAGDATDHERGDGTSGRPVTAVLGTGSGGANQKNGRASTPPATVIRLPCELIVRESSVR